jgi:hypothetical protein
LRNNSKSNNIVKLKRKSKIERHRYSRITLITQTKTKRKLQIIVKLIRLIDLINIREWISVVLIILKIIRICYLLPNTTKTKHLKIGLILPNLLKHNKPLGNKLNLNRKRGRK